MIRLVVLLALLAGPAGAQVLRSGEHGSFTRLAFTRAEPIDWSVNQSGREVEIAFTPAPALDLSRIYDRIGPDRIASVDRLGDRLRISLGCDCVATVGRSDIDQITIDIAPGTPPPAANRPVPRSIVSAPGPDISAGIPKLPLLLEPLSGTLAPRLRRAAREDVIGPRRPPFGEAEGTLNIPRDQLVVRDGRAMDIRLAAPIVITQSPQQIDCEGADRLHDILMQDPQEAYHALPDLIAAEDRNQDAYHASVRDGYYAAGLATEASHYARSVGIKDRWSALLKAASGEAIASAPRPVRASCGPAAALLALATGADGALILGVLRSEMLTLARDLPAKRRAELVPKAADAAEAQGLDGLAAELRALLPVDADPFVSPVEAAAEDVAQTLEQTPSDATLPPAAVAEADALYRELPQTATRSRIERALVLEAAMRGDSAKARTLLSDLSEADRVAALDRLSDALRALPPARFIVLATALLPLRDETPLANRQALATRLEEEGFPDLAERWHRETDPRPRLANQVIRTRPPQDDDATADRPSATRLATLAGPLEGDPPDTLTGAETRLDRSREAATLVTELLADEDGSTDR